MACIIGLPHYLYVQITYAESSTSQGHVGHHLSTSTRVLYWRQNFFTSLLNLFSEILEINENCMDNYWQCCAVFTTPADVRESPFYFKGLMIWGKYEEPVSGVVPAELIPEEGRDRRHQGQGWKEWMWVEEDGLTECKWAQQVTTGEALGSERAAVSHCHISTSSRSGTFRIKQFIHYKHIKMTKTTRWQDIKFSSLYKTSKKPSSEMQTHSIWRFSSGLFKQI